MKPFLRCLELYCLVDQLMEHATSQRHCTLVLTQAFPIPTHYNMCLQAQLRNCDFVFGHDTPDSHMRNATAYTASAVLDTYYY